MTDSTDRPDPAPSDRSDPMTGADALQAMNPDSLMQRMGIEVLEATADRLVATRARAHRATKCLRNLRTWLTWYATL